MNLSLLQRQTSGFSSRFSECKYIFFIHFATVDDKDNEIMDRLKKLEDDLGIFMLAGGSGSSGTGGGTGADLAQIQKLFENIDHIEDRLEKVEKKSKKAKDNSKKAIKKAKKLKDKVKDLDKNKLDITVLDDELDKLRDLIN